MEFNFLMPVKIIFGTGKINELNKIIKPGKILVVCDKTTIKLGFTEKIEKKFNCDLAIFDEVMPNPSCELIDKAAEIARKNNIECVIGLGGGSSLDTAKAVACLIENEGRIIDYLYGEKTFSKRTAKLVLIPTTAGTGSEVTNVGVYTDEDKKSKKPMTSEYFWGDYAVVDPELTYTMPPSVTAATGLDALVHCVEAYWAVTSQPLCDAIAMKTIKIILDNLETAYREPDNKKARESISLASMMAGVSFSQTRTTASHAISFPLTNIYGIEHGIACILTLPSLIDILYDSVRDKMDELLYYLGLKDIKELSGRIRSIMKNMNVKQNLSYYGIQESELIKITEISMNANIFYFTPKKLEKEETLKMLQNIL